MNEVNMDEIARIYREWGFTPLPVRDYLKFPAHLRIRQHTVESLVNMSRTTSFADATGIWLLLHEPRRDDGYVHVAVDFDELPSSSDWPQDRQKVFRDRVWNTFAYFTARGIHAHFLVPRDQIPASFTARVRKVYAGGDGKHVADVFVFAPADDPQFKTSWRMGVLAYPSIARNDHDPSGGLIRRRLLTGQLLPPAKIMWADLENLLRAVFGDYTFDRPSTQSTAPARITLSLSAATTASGRVSAQLASVLRTLRTYSCVAEVLPTVNPAGVITHPPSRVVKEGNRNNALMAILSVAARVATPHVDTVVELARLVNRFTMDPPLSDAEVLRVVQSVVGGGYEMRPPTFAERMGLTDLCALCPMHTICYGDDVIEAEVPNFEEIPADKYFPAQYFRGQQQKELYHQLVKAVSDPATRIVLGLAPTGSGKTLHSTGLASMAVKERKTSVVVLVPTKQLQNQHRRWLSRAGVPHVVFKGRKNYACPFLNLIREEVVRRYGESAVEQSADWSAASAPCAIADSCRRYMWAKSVLKKAEARDADVSTAEVQKAQQVVRDFHTALRATLMEHFTIPVPLALDHLEDYIAEGAATCPYMQVLDSVRSYVARNPAGVIVANKSLLFVARSVAERGATAPQPTIVILDEAHSLVDGLFAPARMMFHQPEDVVAVDSVMSLLSEELQRTTAMIRETQQALDSISAREVKSNKERDNLKKEVRRLRRKLVHLKRYAQTLQELAYLVATDPSAFVIDSESKKGEVYIRVLKNRRAKVLREYLLRNYPNTQFIMLTATGSELSPIADVVISVDDVIPVKNRQILYLPLMRLSAQNLKEQVRKVYQTRVAPTILAQYAALAPLLAKKYGVEVVRGLVHEVSKERAIYLARALVESGYPVLLYAGTDEDIRKLENLLNSAAPATGNVARLMAAAEDLRAIREADNARVITTLEHAVAEFKQNRKYLFFVSVALETGHDFDEDDIMLQWVVKVPYPLVDDVDYKWIERAEGKAARDRQYTYDSLLKLIQMAGRTTRKPDQYSMTIVLDAALPSLLSRAWRYGYEDDVLTIAKRLVVPARYKEYFKDLPEQVINEITFKE